MMESLVVRIRMLLLLDINPKFVDTVWKCHFK